jgi:hypothetical protein
MDVVFPRGSSQVIVSLRLARRHGQAFEAQEDKGREKGAGVLVLTLLSEARARCAPLFKRPGRYRNQRQWFAAFGLRRESPIKKANQGAALNSTLKCV